MDYYDDDQVRNLNFNNFQWSTCSVEDFQDFYLTKIHQAKQFCLDKKSNNCKDLLDRCLQWTEYGTTCFGHILKYKMCPKSCNVC